MQIDTGVAMGKWQFDWWNIAAACLLSVLLRHGVYEPPALWSVRVYLWSRTSCNSCGLSSVHWIKGLLCYKQTLVPRDQI